MARNLILIVSVGTLLITSAYAIGFRIHPEVLTGHFFKQTREDTADSKISAQSFLTYRTEDNFLSTPKKGKTPAIRYAVSPGPPPFIKTSALQIPNVPPALKIPDLPAVVPEAVFDSTSFEIEVPALPQAAPKVALDLMTREPVPYAAEHVRPVVQTNQLAVISHVFQIPGPLASPEVTSNCEKGPCLVEEEPHKTSESIPPPQPSPQGSV